MSEKKLTAAFVASVHARKRAGLSARQIAREKGVSRQTVDRALAESAASTGRTKTMRASKKSPIGAGPVAQVAQPAAQSTTGNLDEGRAIVAELARGLAAEARDAKAKGDAGAYASLAPKAQSAVLALAKLSPEAAEAEQEGVYVTHDDMAKSASTGRTKILERVARGARGPA